MYLQEALTTPKADEPKPSHWLRKLNEEKLAKKERLEKEKRDKEERLKNLLAEERDDSDESFLLKFKDL